MLKKFLIYIALTTSYLFAQQDTTLYLSNYSLVIDSIKISGNETTQDFIIRRELTFSPGDTLTQKVADYNKDRIYSLGIFNQVKVYPITVNNKNYAVISVNEGWYIYPVPFMEIRENDWKKLSYGAILVIKNFRGRNETISLSGAFGYNPFVKLMYYNPYLIRDEDIFFNVSATYGTSLNRSNIAKVLHGEDFDQKMITGNIEIGKRFGLYQRLYLDLGYTYIETPFYIKGISASDSRIDHNPFISTSYTFDTRDLVQFPKTGFFGLASVKFNGLGIDGINYQVENLDLRAYHKLLGDLNGKIRFMTRLTGGKLIPFYDLSYIGYEERVRGHFTEQLEGNNSYFGSVEFYYPLLKDIQINLNFVPLLPRELLSYRVAFYAEIFNDWGATKFKGESLSLKDFKKGYGGGFTLLILPYNVIRFEVGLNESHKTEFILNVAVSF
jgi:outer membrane protein insertion porin family